MLGLLQVKEATGQVTLGSGFRWNDYGFNHIRIYLTVWKGRFYNVKLTDLLDNFQTINLALSLSRSDNVYFIGLQRM